MKKLFALLLSICMLLGMFTGCGIDSDSDSDVNNVSGGEGDDVEVTVEETVVYEDNGVKITVTGMEEGWAGTELNVLVENSTEQDLCLTADNVIVNGISMYCLGYIEVAAGKKANDSITIYSESLEAAGVTNIATLEFVDAYFFNTESYETVFELSFDVVTSLGEDYEQAINDEGEVIYDENGITVILQVIDDEFYGHSLQILVMNESDKNVIVTADNISVNDFTVTAWMYDCVYANTVRYCALDLYDSELEENDIDEIEQIEFDIEIYNEDNIYDTVKIDGVVVDVS